MILCCGEALIDLIPGETGPQPLVGGSVLNTAVALGRLGTPVGLLTGLSSDEHGQMIEAHLRESDVDTSLCIRTARPTTLAIVTFENGQPRYEFRDEGSALRMIEPGDLPALPQGIAAMVFGGISLIGTPVADTLADACTHRPASVSALLDANIRPGFVDDVGAYRARLSRMMARATMVKVSDEDLDWLLPGDPDPVQTLLTQGPELVLLTKGPEGAEARTRLGVTAKVPAQKVDVADTVGAGDTFNAGLLAALHEAGRVSPAAIAEASEDTLCSALDLAVRAAAITVSRAGANPPWAHELVRGETHATL